MQTEHSEIAVLIPCYNEEQTVAKVIQDFRKELPEAKIYVFDNRSSDQTATIARENGATVISELRKGKGSVVGSMFRLIDAEIYILVDGDDTYPADEVHQLIQPIREQNADMVCGDRITNGSYESENKRAFHNMGNILVPWLIGTLFRVRLIDGMTGYRVFNRRFVKTLPVLSKGFEIEVEMTMTALHYNFRILEVPIGYRDRPEGSISKLNTVRDGILILSTIFEVFRKYKPLSFFSLLSLVFLIGSLFMGVPVILDYMETGLVDKFPSAFLSLGLGIIGIVLFCVGLILHTVSKMNRELMDVLAKAKH